MSKNVLSLACLAALSGLAAGCVPHVALSPMPSVYSTEWSAPVPAQTGVGAPGHLAALLGDPALAELMEQARANSPDIAIAAARLDAARAELTAARRASLPELSATAGLSSEMSKATGSRLDFEEAFAQLDVSWELDLGGRFRARSRAALARAEAAQWEREAVVLAIESELARAWVQRAALTRRLEIYDRLIDRAVELERVVRAREEAGAATRVELGLQTIRLLGLRRQHSELTESLDRTRTAIAVLVGAEAPRFSAAGSDMTRLALPSLAAPPPPRLLAARPDIRRAEAEIAAARGDVAAARASFFPQVNLSASGVLTALSGNPVSEVVTAGSSLLAPIFSRGRLGRDLRVASAQQVEAVETYRRAVLAALAEVEDLNSAVLGSAQRAELVELITAEAELTARVANIQYLEGEEDLQTLIDAEELLGEAEEAQALLWQERMFAQIALYSAMGGYLASGATPLPPAPAR